MWDAEKKLKDKIVLLQKYIDESENIVFFGGAGVSTESGIPDFRSQDGLYNQKYDYPPEEILSHNFFLRHMAEFYKFYRDKMIVSGVTPNVAHLTLAKLEECGKLKAIVTQNIDGLHQAAGSKCVYELHGSVLRNYCMRCGKAFGVEAIVAAGANSDASAECGSAINPGSCADGASIADSSIAGGGAVAGGGSIVGCDSATGNSLSAGCDVIAGATADGIPRCECGGKIKPDVVLYEEGLDDATVEGAVKSISEADLLIIGGTSLNVYPAAGLIRYFGGSRIVLINRDETPADKYASLVFHESIGKVLGELRI